MRISLNALDAMYHTGLNVRWRHRNHGIYPLKPIAKHIIKARVRRKSDAT